MTGAVRGALRISPGMRTGSSRTVQPRQPLFITTTCSADASNGSSSMPASPIRFR
jgi:uncharacterized membrane protein